MIEINLLPGTGKKPRSKGAPGASLAGVASGVAARVRDPYLISAIVSVLLVGSLIGTAYWYQRAQYNALNEQLQKAIQDSTRLSGVIREQRKAQTQRDSVLAQVELIRSFDNKRFVWPHIMDEISRALPPYTWITSVVQTNGSTAQPAQPTTGKPAKPGEKTGPPPVDSSSVPKVQFRLVGNTVDIQALTRFMKLLEASPFIENVQLEKSSIILVDGKEVTEFALTASYQNPDPSAIKMQPVNLSVR